MNEIKTPRQVALFDVEGRSLTTYAIARLCGANRSTFDKRVKKDGYTVRQAVNELGRISYDRLVEKLA